MLQALRMFLWMLLLTGVLYPLLITGIAQGFMKQKADGSFLAVGSKNIAQKFESEKYFWPRPSFNDYNPLHSGGSNFGPTSKALKEAIEARKQKITKAHSGAKAPAELLFASGSGLDPHISVSTAYYQMERVAKARKTQMNKIKDLIDQMGISSLFWLQERYINVLLLNIALDEEFHDK